MMDLVTTQRGVTASFKPQDWKVVAMDKANNPIRRPNSRAVSSPLCPRRQIPVPDIAL